MPVELQKIEYVRIVAPPTLKQFLINRAVKEASAKTKEVNGVTRVKGKLMPKSAAMLQRFLVGITAEKVKKEHPEWADEYPDFVKEWHEKRKS